ncbi:Glycosyltransferase family 92 protein [Caenorhabditis elegans]|uniref:Glycosyltransferase family 92 protein n=1 Tax=Caenorhabditis elegans TaxID=6239 RepID=Q9NEJ9_CAEEL|nr:Glycosyltransferase family 92 protein [Caenorhabditis elegans]CAB81978.3 Glycosyltransferase family 92 protein [Caenorhabditis elegans]|eukprot:NP_001024218.1 Uncharacterized protein CELE_Y116F11B.9 [Caenorhabditis elegans]
MRIYCQYQTTLIFLLFLAFWLYFWYYLLIDLVYGVTHLVIPLQPLKNRELKAFVTSAYYYPTSKSLGDNAVALVMSINLGRNQEEYLEIESGKSTDSGEISIWAKNATTSILVNTPSIRVTPHNFCEMVTIFATTQLLPNIQSILLVAEDGSTEIPFSIPSYKPRDFVVCLSPLYVFEQWQNFLLSVHIYKKFGGFLHLYLISVVSPLFSLMKQYESADYLKIQAWPRVNFPFIMPKYVDPFVGVEFQNQAAAYTDCLLQYKESAQFITFLDIDDVIIPRLAPTYVEEFQKIIGSQKRISYIIYHQKSYNLKVSKRSSEFSISKMLKNLKFRDGNFGSGQKIVANPRYLNYTWIEPTSFSMAGTSYVDTDKNVITQLDNIKWTNSISTTSQAPLYLNSSEYLISPENLEDLDSDFQKMQKSFEIDQILPDLPSKLYYFNSVRSCLTKKYFNYVKLEKYGKTQCPGPQMCKFQKRWGVQCVHVNATHVLMKKLNPITYYYASDPYFTSDMGCVPQ